MLSKTHSTKHFNHFTKMKKLFFAAAFITASFAASASSSVKTSTKVQFVKKTTITISYSCGVTAVVTFPDNFTTTQIVNYAISQNNTLCGTSIGSVQ
jgi:hypothetical protein